MSEFPTNALGAAYILSAHSWYSKMHGRSFPLSEAWLLTSSSVVEASCSKFGGLPVFDENSTYNPIPEQLFSWPQKAGYQVLKNLGEEIKAYKSFRPPHVSPSEKWYRKLRPRVQGSNGYFVHPKDRSHLLLLPQDLLPEDEIEQWVTETMPDQFLHMNHPLHSSYSPARVLEWIQSRPSLDCQKMVDMGSPGGIRYAFFLLLQMFIQANDLPVLGDSKFKAGFVNTTTITTYGEIAWSQQQFSKQLATLGGSW
jgi:hypothetical protein